MPIYTESKSVSIVAQPTGEIEIVTITTDMKDGEIVGRKKHTRLLAPDADLTTETSAVQAVARGVWTPQTVAALTSAQQSAIAALVTKRAELEALKAEVPTVNGVPQTVTRRQARQALRLAGLIGLVQPAIDAIPDAMQRGLMQDEWDDSQVFERQRPALLQLAGALGLTSEQVDHLFTQAAQL